MKIFIVGATGFIGRHLAKALVGDGHDVIGLSRSAERAKSVLPESVEVVEGDPMQPGNWQKEIDGADAVINVVGEPIMKEKWTPRRKKLLRDSRLVPTVLINDAIKKAQARPAVFLCGSAIGFYGGRGDELLTEESARGDDFSARMCGDWEAEARKAADLGVRVVTLRTSFVLGPGGGALPDMAKPFKMFAGGPIGTGRQYISWIHMDDYIGLVKAALADGRVDGPINMVGGAATNRDFAASLGRTLNRPSWLPVPAFALRLMFGDGAALLLEGQRVAAAKADSLGYEFKYLDLDRALRDALGR